MLVWVMHLILSIGLSYSLTFLRFWIAIMYGLILSLFLINSLVILIQLLFPYFSMLLLLFSFNSSFYSSIPLSSLIRSSARSYFSSTIKAEPPMSPSTPPLASYSDSISSNLLDWLSVKRRSIPILSGLMPSRSESF